jgi:predicted transcriptional regulator
MDKATLYLPAELQQALKQLARRQKRSRAELIREALEQYVRAQPHRLPRSVGIAASGELDATEVKDWIRESWAKRRDHA